MSRMLPQQPQNEGVEDYPAHLLLKLPHANPNKPCAATRATNKPFLLRHLLLCCPIESELMPRQSYL